MKKPTNEWGENKWESVKTTVKIEAFKIATFPFIAIGMRALILANDIFLFIQDRKEKLNKK